MWIEHVIWGITIRNHDCIDEVFTAVLWRCQNLGQLSLKYTLTHPQLSVSNTNESSKAKISYMTSPWSRTVYWVLRILHPEKGSWLPTLSYKKLPYWYFSRKECLYLSPCLSLDFCSSVCSSRYKPQSYFVFSSLRIQVSSILFWQCAKHSDLVTFQKYKASVSRLWIHIWLESRSLYAFSLFENFPNFHLSSQTYIFYFLYVLCVILHLVH